MVLDIVSLPTAKSTDVGSTVMQLPLIPVPHGGEAIEASS